MKFWIGFVVFDLIIVGVVLAVVMSSTPDIPDIEIPAIVPTRPDLRAGTGDARSDRRAAVEARRGGATSAAPGRPEKLRSRWSGEGPVVLEMQPMQEAEVTIPVERAGYWSFSLAGETRLPRVATAAGAAVPTDMRGGALVTSREVEAGEYRLSLIHGGSAAAEVRVAPERIGPDPLAFGGDAKATLSPARPERLWETVLETPQRLAASVRASGERVTVEISRPDGVSIVRESGAAGSGPYVVAAADPLEAGTYRIRVAAEVDAPFELSVRLHDATAMTPLAASERQEYQTLRGCSCRARIDGRDVNVRLAAVVEESATTITGGGVSRSYRLGWAIDGAGDEAWRLPVDLQPSAPSAALPGSRVGVAMGCAGDVVVFASLDRASAWSLSERRLLWSSQLDDFVPLGAGGGAELAVNCSTMATGGGKATVTLDRGRRVQLGLSDGAPR
jgi:hypothetical protein